METRQHNKWEKVGEIDKSDTFQARGWETRVATLESWLTSSDLPR